MSTCSTHPLTRPEVRHDNGAAQARGGPDVQAPTILDPMIQVKDVNLKYGAKQALFDVNLDIPGKKATAFIGPSGCGKSTLLRCLNRMNDLIDNVRIDRDRSGSAGQDIYDPDVDVSELRKRVGMVFQKSNPFPKSIYDNVAYGPRIHGIRNSRLDEIVETEPPGRRPLGRGQGPAARERPGALRRPAAAPVHRPGPRRRARGPPDGRALLRPRPHRHRQDRGADPRPEEPVHDRHRHPQHAAGRAGVGLHRLLPAGRAGGVRRDDPSIFTNPRDRRTEDYITGRFG